MQRCPTTLWERLRIINHLYHTQRGSGKVSFNPHDLVLYYPAESAVCILKRITAAHSSTLHISLCQARPSHVQSLAERCRTSVHTTKALLAILQEQKIKQAMT
jgi:sensor c-di-GMP phosphodiesterase-like protein